MPPDYVLQYLPLEMLGAVAVASAVVWGVVLVRKAWAEVVLPIVHRIRTTAQRVEQVMEDWSGRPARPGVPAQPGVMVRLADYDARIVGVTNAMREYGERLEQQAAVLDEVRHEVKPNSGESAWDKAQKANLEQYLDLRKLVADAMHEIGTTRREMNEALRHNHPDYRPPDWSDRFTD